MCSDQRPSAKPRQDLLDELYYVQDVAGEREQRITALEQELARTSAALETARTDLELLRGSRSWRLTAPLRSLSAFAAGFTRRQGRVERSRDEAKFRSDDGTVASPIVAGTEHEMVTDSVILDREANATPHIFVDVTEFVLQRGKTGVQRVTREILQALVESPPEGRVVQPVFGTAGSGYRAIPAPASAGPNPEPTPITGMTLAVRKGDVFLGLDHAMDSVTHHAPFLRAMQQKGVSLWFVIHDTLPLSRPDCFPPTVCAKFRIWLETVASIADGMICNSLTTANSLSDWLDALQIPRKQPLSIGHFYLGADLPTDTEKPVESSNDTACPEQLRIGTSFLVVGTIEPRKGHAQTLEAFNELWNRGEDVVLVLVGLPGWMTEITVRRIRHHDEFGKRLLWLEHASDAALERLYESCNVLLTPSEGEGFGLPLIEAARHGLPILCRDLPIFHEIAGDSASYFSGYEGSDLAAAVRRWLRERRDGVVPTSKNIRWLTWKQSMEQLLDVVLNGRCDGQWVAGNSFWFPVSDPRMRLEAAALRRGYAVSTGKPGIYLQTWTVCVAAGMYRLRVRGAGDRMSPACWQMKLLRNGEFDVLHFVQGSDVMAEQGLICGDVEFAADSEVAMRIIVQPDVQLTISDLCLQRL